MSTDSERDERLAKQARAIMRLRRDRDRLAGMVAELADTSRELVEKVRFLETVIGTGHIPEHPTSTDVERQPVSDESDTGWGTASIEPGCVPLVEQGIWVERTQCMTCGLGVEAGRTALSCTRCSSQRTRAIRGEIVRPVIARCLNCGADKAPGGMIYLCTPCRKAHKAHSA